MRGRTPVVGVLRESRESSRVLEAYAYAYIESESGDERSRTIAEDYTELLTLTENGGKAFYVFCGS